MVHEVRSQQYERNAEPLPQDVYKRQVIDTLKMSIRLLFMRIRFYSIYLMGMEKQMLIIIWGIYMLIWNNMIQRCV